MPTYHASSNTFILDSAETDFSLPAIRPDTGEPLPANAQIQGNYLANRLTGDSTDNLLNGYGGADVLIGGLGDDIYVVSGSRATVVEQADQGVDYLYAMVSFVLPQHVEWLELMSTFNIDGTGNDEANTLVGNSGHNRLNGLGGVDTINGEGGNDVLDGGLGNDVLKGGVGDDTYHVDQAGDQVIEELGKGFDQVLSSVDYILTAHVENLTASGSGSISLTGNELVNAITGNGGKNILRGGSGNDMLTGGTGNDIFVLDAVIGTYKTNKLLNLDTITDFSVKDDSIWLDNAIFAKLGRKGTEAKPAKLDKQFFVIGSKAKDKSDYLVYDKKKGVLSYDADGSGKGKAVEIAKLDANLNLTHKDFFVI